MLSKRIIACLDVRDGKVVKGVNFEGLRDAGDPAALARRYNGDGIAAGTQVYFTHSFAAPVTADTIASTTHGKAFAAAVQRDNVCGVQFHPEKSGDAGLQILRNFLGLI